MVVDPQPAARYQPAEPYINRAAPKSKGLKKKTEGRGRTNETRREKHKDTSLIFKLFLEPHNRSKPFPHQYRPKTTKPETSQERERRCSENRA